MADDKILLYDPADAPIEGLASAPNPMGLPIGLYPLMQNYRFGEGNLVVRYGCPAALSTAGSGDYRGSWTGNLNGTEQLFEARRISGETIVYSVNLSTWARTERTAASGQYGNTRLATDGQVSFAKIRFPGIDFDFLVFQNGADAPRIYDANLSLTAVVQAIEGPSPGGNNLPAVEQGVRSFVTVSAAGLTESTSGGGISSATAGAAPDVRQAFTITNAVATNDWANLAFSAADFQNGAQLLLLVDSTYMSIWENIRVYLTEGATFDDTNTVWDGQTGSYSYGIAEADPYGGTHSGKYLIGFPLDKIPNASRNAIINLRLQWVGATAPSANQTLNIYGIFCGGNHPGYTQWALTYFNSGSHTESPGYRMDSSTSVLVRNIGGASLGDMKLPVSESIYYHPKLSFITPTQAMADAGVDYILFYRKEPQEDEYEIWTNRVSATYAGTWTVSGGAQVLVSSTTLSESALYRPRPLPPGDHEPIPTGKHMIVANQRLYVGNLSTSKLDVKISRDGLMSRFLSALKRIDPYSATRVTAPHAITGFKSMSAAAMGAQVADVEAVYVHTELERYQSYGIDGFSLSRLRPVDAIGTRSPWSIAGHEGEYLWVDDELQVRHMSAEGTRNISRGIVDEIEGVPASRVPYIVGLVRGDRYYLFYTPSGGTANTKCLVYHLVKKRWESNDLLPGAITGEGALKVYLAGNEPYYLVLIASDGKLYRYEQKGLTTDLGSNIATELHWPMLHKGLSKGKKLGRWRVLADADPTSSTLAASATYLADGSVHSANISLVSADSVVLRTYAPGTETVTPSGGDAKGSAVQPKLTGSLPGGTVIYAIEADIEDRDLTASLAD